MTDSLLTPTDIEEALSRVYVQAVAARVGYTTADYSQDRDGIDILIRAGGKDASGPGHITEGDDLPGQPFERVFPLSAQV